MERFAGVEEMIVDGRERPELKRVGFESLTNIRPRQLASRNGNKDPVLREITMRQLLEIS